MTVRAPAAAPALLVSLHDVSPLTVDDCAYGCAVWLVEKTKFPLAAVRLWRG